MADTEDYEDIDHDVSSLEDNPQELLGEKSIISEDVYEMLTHNTPIYRLRLVYSRETFHAAWTGAQLETGISVVVPTRYGRDLAEVLGQIQRRSGQVPANMTRIERIATEEDLTKAKANVLLEKEAFDICREKISARNIDMKLVSVHYLLEDPKILFFFTAENRVDFRDLVKDLVAIFKNRIELRQIGVRDEAREVGGLGVCGRGYCCHSVSDKLKPVSIKMAKEQNLSLNTMKISGPCGRLLCCLSYEQQFYGDQRRVTPNEGTSIHWNDSLWKVTEVNIVLGKLKLTAEDGRTIQLPVSSLQKTDGRWSIVQAP